MNEYLKTEKKIPVLTASELEAINSSDYVKTDKETTFAELLTRYMNELKAKGITEQDISCVTGLTQSAISDYLNGKKKPSDKSLYALCIGMRLYFNRSKMLITMSGKKISPFNKRDRIVEKYLMYCSVSYNFDVASCNQELKENHSLPLTKI